MPNVFLLPGVDVAEIPGVPRYDMAYTFRDLADRAEAGEFRSMAVVAVRHSGGPATETSSTWISRYELIGALDVLKAELVADAMADREEAEARGDLDDPEAG